MKFCQTYDLQESLDLLVKNHEKSILRFTRKIHEKYLKAKNFWKESLQAWT